MLFLYKTFYYIYIYVYTNLKFYFIFCLQMGQWHPADEYDGQVREITFRAPCNNPMCPPDSAMTEWQHAVLSPDKKTLVRQLMSALLESALSSVNIL